MTIAQTIDDVLVFQDLSLAEQARLQGIPNDIHLQVFEQMRKVRGQGRCGLKIYSETFCNAMTFTVVEAIARSLLPLLVVHSVGNH